MKRKFFVVLFFCFLFCVFVAVSFLLALELRDRSFSSINNSTEYKERQGPPLNWKSHFISVYFTSPGIKGGEVEIIKELVVFLNSARESIYSNRILGSTTAYKTSLKTRPIKVKKVEIVKTPIIRG